MELLTTEKANFVKMFVFKNRQTELVTNLYLGFRKVEGKNDLPVYHFSSKEIPITGEFTGFPTHIMIEWMDKIGYKLEMTLKLDKNRVCY